MGAGSTIRGVEPKLARSEFQMGSFGWPEILIILLIVIILFGARRIPDVAKGLGEGIRSFKAGMRGDERQQIDERKYSDDTQAREESRRSV
jgi:sec-independent protein translocase protein TatA